MKHIARAEYSLKIDLYGPEIYISRFVWHDPVLLPDSRPLAPPLLLSFSPSLSLALHTHLPSLPVSLLAPSLALRTYRSLACCFRHCLPLLFSPPQPHHTTPRHTTPSSSHPRPRVYTRIYIRIRTRNTRGTHTCARPAVASDIEALVFSPTTRRAPLPPTPAGRGPSRSGHSFTELRVARIARRFRAAARNHAFFPNNTNTRER